MEERHWLETLGTALRMLRAERGWTQQELSDGSGVGKPLLSGYERGRSEPKLSTVAKILEAMEFDFGDLQRTLDHLRRGELPAEPRRESGESARVAASFLVFQLAGSAQEERPAAVDDRLVARAARLAMEIGSGLGREEEEHRDVETPHEGHG